MKKIKLKKETKEKLKNLNVSLVYIFGSSVYGIENKKSDVDIGVLFKQNAKVNIEKYLHLFKIFSDIYKDKNVDIVFLNDAPLTLRFEIVNDGIIIYEEKKHLSYEYKEKVIKEYIDFKYHLEEFNKVTIESI